MKETYWRQSELENEEFRRQKENEQNLKLKQEQEQLHENDTQQRRKIWQRLARRKVHQGKPIENTANHQTRASGSGDDDDDFHHQLHHIGAPDGRVGLENNNNIDIDIDDDFGENNATFDKNVVADHDDDDENENVDKFRQRSEEEILQRLREQQERLFSATAAAAVKEKQQVKQRQQQPVKRADENELNLSFCGCGFLGIYHVGVASCFHEYAPQLSMHKISGSSAGALVAIAHICGNLQLAYATTDILRVAIDARARTLGPFHPSFDINAIVREALEKGLPDDVHERANGKLHVSLTRVYDGENVVISEFASKEDVIQVLLCSCFIPFWSGLVAPKFRGVTYIDGGFSNNLLTLDDKTVTVSPFSGEADICPQDDTFNLLQVSLSNTSFSLSPNNLYRLSHALLPPPPEILSDLCEQGFADGIRFLQRMKLISCTKCLEIRSSLLVTTNGEDMEEVLTCELEDALGGNGGGPSATGGTLDDVSGWKRFSSNRGGKSSTAFTGAASQDSSETHLNHQQQQQQHFPHIILEQQEQKTIEINTATGHRRDSIRSTTSQVFIQQQQNSSKQHHLDSSSSSSATATTATSSGSTAAASLEPRQRFPSSWQLNVNNDDDNNNNNRDATPAMVVLLPPEQEDNASLASCNECVQMRQRALNQAMPKQFSDRIRDACDTVNKSLLNWIYSHRPIKYLSYLAAPYFLPLDIAVALVYKCWRRLPFIRSELTNCIQELVGFLIGIMKRMLARTTSTLLVESSSNWESNCAIGEYETKELLVNRTSSHATAAAAVASASAAAQAKLAVQVSAATAESTDNKDNLSSLSTTTNHRNSDCCSVSSGNSAPTSESHYSLRITSDGVCLSKQSRHSGSASQLHSLEDTFDSIVDVTSNQEARIFAYYFRDAKNRLQVTEIFDYQRASASPTAELNVNNPITKQLQPPSSPTKRQALPTRQHH